MSDIWAFVGPIYVAGISVVITVGVIASFLRGDARV